MRKIYLPDYIKYRGDNNIFCLLYINEEIIDYCIDKFYFEELGDTFVINTLIEPPEEYREICKKKGREKNINIICVKAQQGGGG